MVTPRGLQVRTVHAGTRDLRYPLVLSVAWKQKAPTLKLTYSPQRLDEETVSRLLEDLPDVLARFGKYADKRLGDASPLRRGWSSGLVALQNEGGGKPFFWVHPAGGTVWCYAALARHLGQDQPFYAFTASPTRKRQEMVGRVEVLAARYIERMRRAQWKGPYRLGGWSTGGLVAYDMARQLREQGQEVELLALVDILCPDPAKKPKVLAPHEMLVLFARQLGLRLNAARMASLSPTDVLSIILKQAKAAHLVPADLNAKGLLEILRLYRAHVLGAQLYVAISCPVRVTVFQAEKTKKATSPDLGWERVASELDTHAVPGGHGTVLREPNVQVLAKQLKGCLTATV
jgi:thioesterase domain-containing protein